MATEWQFDIMKPPSTPGISPNAVMIFVQDCQLLDFLVNIVVPFALFFWIVTVFCRNRQSKYEEMHRTPVEVNAVPVEVKTSK